MMLRAPQGSSRDVVLVIPKGLRAGALPDHFGMELASVCPGEQPAGVVGNTVHGNRAGRHEAHRRWMKTL